MVRVILIVKGKHIDLTMSAAPREGDFINLKSILLRKNELQRTLPDNVVDNIFRREEFPVTKVTWDWDSYYDGHVKVKCY